MPIAEVDLQQHGAVQNIRYIPLSFQLKPAASFMDSNGQENELVAQESRLKNIPYRTHVHLQTACVETDEDGFQTRTVKPFWMGKLAPQVKGLGCTLEGMTPRECAKLGECERDVGGYYLVTSESTNKTHEYIIRQSEYYTLNRVRVRERDGERAAVVLSYPNAATERHFDELSVQVDKQTRLIQVLRSSSSAAQPLPIALVFRAYGIRSQAEMYELFADHSPWDKAQMLQWLQPTFDADAAVGGDSMTQEDALDRLIRDFSILFKKRHQTTQSAPSDEALDPMPDAADDEDADPEDGDVKMVDSDSPEADASAERQKCRNVLRYSVLPHLGQKEE
jgi:DNA-directed RNA polymerase beta subunit